MLTLLMLLAIAWFCRRALAWIALRATALAIGFAVGWRLMQKP